MATTRSSARRQSARAPPITVVLATTALALAGCAGTPSLTGNAGVEVVRDLRLRWVGHRLTGSATVEVDATDLHTAEHIARHAAEHVHKTIGNMGQFTVTPSPHTYHH